MVRICYVYETGRSGGRETRAGLLEVPARKNAPHLLVVHSGAADLRLLRRILSRDYRAGLASALSAAQAYLCTQRPDALLLDVRLWADSRAQTETLLHTWPAALLAAVPEDAARVCGVPEWRVIRWPVPEAQFLAALHAFLVREPA